MIEPADGAGAGGGLASIFLECHAPIGFLGPESAANPPGNKEYG
jgi:hypothetical protein